MPDIVVVGPDGNRYVFPEGTSRDVMRQAMQKRFPQPQAKQRTPSRLEAFGAGIGEAIPRAIGGIIEFLDPQGRKLLTPEQKRAYDAQFANVRRQRPNVFTTGQVAGEVLATAPVVSGGGKIAEKVGETVSKIATRPGVAARIIKGGGRVLQQTGRAVQSGGTGVRAVTPAAAARGAPVAATRTGRMALRVAGGGGSAAATAALTDQDVLDAAAAGSLIPVAGTIVRRGVGATYDLLAGRLGELRAAEIMRNVIADKSTGIIDALKNAPKNVKANTAEFLASKGLLTPELAAATRIVSAGKYSKPLEQKALAAAEERNAMKTMVQGGGTQTEAMQNIAAAKQAVRDEMDPRRVAFMERADIGRTQIVPSEQRSAQLRTAAANESRRAARFYRAADEQGAALGQMDDLGDVFNPEAINRQRGIVGALEKRGLEAGKRSVQLGQDSRDAAEVAANLREQGLAPIDISQVTGRLRTLANEALPGTDRRRIFNKFADMLDKRAQQFGGIIDATGLHLARREMGDFVASTLGSRGADAAAVRRGTAQLMGEAQPLIDDAFEAAGGPEWRSYLNDFSQGMREVERQEFGRQLAKLPEARYAKVMAGEDPDFVSDFFGPGRFDINVEMGAAKLPEAQQLAGDITASRAVQQGGLGELSPSQRLSLPTGARARVEDAMTPGLNTFARTMANVTGRIPGISGGGLAAAEVEQLLANKMAERTMRQLAPALAEPSIAARLLQTGPSATDYLGTVFSERLAPQTRNALARMLTQSFIRPTYTPAETNYPE